MDRLDESYVELDNLNFDNAIKKINEYDNRINYLEECKLKKV